MKFIPALISSATSDYNQTQIIYICLSCITFCKCGAMMKHLSIYRVSSIWRKTKILLGDLRLFAQGIGHKLYVKLIRNRQIYRRIHSEYKRSCYFFFFRKRRRYCSVVGIAAAREKRREEDIITNTNGSFHRSDNLESITRNRERHTAC